MPMPLACTMGVAYLNPRARAFGKEEPIQDMNIVFGPLLDVHISMLPTANMQKVLTQHSKTSQHTAKFWVVLFIFSFYKFCFLDTIVLSYQLEPLQ
jgi:hypothetical protein